MVPRGFEPRASAVSRQRSIQLSYGTISIGYGDRRTVSRVLRGGFEPPATRVSDGHSTGLSYRRRDEVFVTYATAFSVTVILPWETVVFSPLASSTSQL